MGIKYELAPDIQEQVDDIAKTLFLHVRLDSVVCIRSYGSSSRGTIARCHAMGKAMQIALQRKGFYVIEVISKRFDRLPEIDKTRTLIHELMHIPKSFGGGFIHHNIVHDKNVEKEYQRYVNLKKGNSYYYDNEKNKYFESNSNIDYEINNKPEIENKEVQKKFIFRGKIFRW
jgi:predicted metallopeptidase